MAHLNLAIGGSWPIFFFFNFRCVDESMCVFFVCGKKLNMCIQISGITTVLKQLAHKLHMDYRIDTLHLIVLPLEIVRFFDELFLKLNEVNDFSYKEYLKVVWVFFLLFLFREKHMLLQNATSTDTLQTITRIPKRVNALCNDLLWAATHKMQRKHNLITRGVCVCVYVFVYLCDQFKCLSNFMSINRSGWLWNEFLISH